MTRLEREIVAIDPKEKIDPLRSRALFITMESSPTEENPSLNSYY